MAWRAAMLRCGTAAAADSPEDAFVVDLEWIESAMESCE